jgi:hypothetical protein
MATLPQAVRPSAPGAAVLAAQPPGRTAPERGPVRLPGPDRSAATGPRSAVRSWPLLVLAAPAAAEVWTGWVGIAARTGFGLISPLALAAHLHDDHLAGRRRGIRGVRAARLARPRRRRQPADTPLRPAVRDLLLRARRRRAGRLPPAGAGRDNPRRGLLPPSCPACRSWSSRWGPRSRTCCTATRWPRRPDQALSGTSAQIGPRARSARTRPRPLRTGRTT